jgi:hypothetical protein
VEEWKDKVLAFAARLRGASPSEGGEAPPADQPEAQGGERRESAAVSMANPLMEGRAADAPEEGATALAESGGWRAFVFNGGWRAFFSVQFAIRFENSLSVRASDMRRPRARESR